MGTPLMGWQQHVADVAGERGHDEVRTRGRVGRRHVAHHRDVEHRAATRAVEHDELLVDRRLGCGEVDGADRLRLDVADVEQSRGGRALGGDDHGGRQGRGRREDGRPAPPAVSFPDRGTAAAREAAIPTLLGLTARLEGRIPEGARELARRP